MAFPLFSNHVRLRPLTLHARGAQGSGSRAKSRLGILGLLLLALFVAQTSALSIHGHTAVSDAGLAGDTAFAVEIPDAERESLASEGCAVCEMAQRIGSEALSPALTYALSLPVEPTGVPNESADRAPARIEYARAAPRAPPIAFV